MWIPTGSLPKNQAQNLCLGGSSGFLLVICVGGDITWFINQAQKRKIVAMSREGGEWIPGRVVDRLQQEDFPDAAWQNSLGT